MILPTKYIPFGETYLFVGGIILKNLNAPRTVGELWRRVRRETAVATLDRFYLALDFLYTLKLIAFTKGVLHRRNDV